jgi:hypothetical protein
MTKKIILRTTFLALLVLFFFQPSDAGADLWKELVVDRDGDGLGDSIEAGGWRNASGGPFKTGLLDPDSDNDGLTDGEEKLFDTHPLSQNSPGAYVEYEPGFKTREYFHATNNAEPRRDGGGPNAQTLGGGYLHWDMGGSRRILTEGVVVRRGTTFLLKGPPGANLKIEKFRGSQSGLSVTENFCQGGWNIKVDNNETVGIYTAVLTLGNWRDELPIYVIFELPTPHNGNGIHDISQADVEAFLYDDNPANLKDETVVWWNPRGSDYFNRCGGNSGPCDDEPYRYARGYMQGFPSDQYKKYVFRDRVMPAVSGASDQGSGINRIADKADREIRVNFDVIRVSMFDALRRFWDGNGYTQVGGACDANASVFSGFGRSAGIMIKPFIVDWNTGNRGYHGESATSGLTDTSALVWVNNQWRGMRSYNRNEQQAADLKYYPFTGGVKPLGSIFKWYSDQQGDLMLTMDDQFHLNQVNLTLDPQYEFSTNELFTAKWDYYWDSRRPLAIQKDPGIQTLTVPVWKGDPWTPNDWGREVYVLPNPYPGGNLGENWPIEPEGYRCSPETPGNCPFDLTREVEEPAFLTAAPPPPEEGAAVMITGGATFDGSYSHNATDTNGDGAVDALIVELGLAITQPGTFSAEAELYDAAGEWIGTATWEGSGPTVRLQFDNAAGRPGPYVLRYVYLSDQSGNSSDILGNLSLKPLSELYHGKGIHLGTSPEGDLSSKGTTITPTLTFSHSTPDADGDGKKDALIINAGMTVAQAGTYRLEGWLVAANGQLVAWAQSVPTALGTGKQTLSLGFGGRLINDRGLPGPYTLQELKVLSGNTGTFNVLDEVQVTGLKLQYNPNQFETTSIFADNLEGGVGKWGSAASTWSLVENEFFSSSHAWRANARGSENGSLTTVAINTANYVSPTLRFQSCTQGRGAAQSFVEASTDGANWTQVGVYGAEDHPWLTRQLNLSAFGKKPQVLLRFRANTSGNATLNWSIDDVRLNGWPAIIGVAITRNPAQPLTKPNTTITFKAKYNTIDKSLPISFVWRIGGKVVGNGPTLAYTFGAVADYQVEVTVSNPYDSAKALVYIGGGIPVSSADFLVAKSDSDVKREGTFTALYLPANASNTSPNHLIRYTWNFGDGSASQTVTTPILNHTFPANGTYLVTLTVTNGYGPPVVVRKQVVVPYREIIRTYLPLIKK